MWLSLIRSCFSFTRIDRAGFLVTSSSISKFGSEPNTTITTTTTIIAATAGDSRRRHLGRLSRRLGPRPVSRRGSGAGSGGGGAGSGTGSGGGDGGGSVFVRVPFLRQVGQHANLARAHFVVDDDQIDEQFHQLHDVEKAKPAE